MPEEAPVNTGAPWPVLSQARERVLGMQTKLHQWRLPMAGVSGGGRRTRPRDGCQREDGGPPRSRMREASASRTRFRPKAQAASAL